MIFRSMQEQSEVECMKRILIKIWLLPVYLVLMFASRIYHVGLKVFSFGFGIIYLIMFLFLLLAGFNQQWQNLGILAVIFAGAVLITFLFGLVGVFIESWKERVKAIMS